MIYRRKTKLYPKQKAFVDDPARFVWVEASTKAGKTAACIIWLFEQAVLSGRGNYWWVAPIYGQTKIAYNRLRKYLAKGGNAAVVAEINQTELRITLVNGASLWFKSGDKPDGLYGDDVKAAVVDEASRVKADAYDAVYSTLTHTRGRLRAIGNVKGTKNWFYAACRRAEGLHPETLQPIPRSPDHSYHRLTADDAVAGGVIDPDIIEQARRDLDPKTFRELYFAEPQTHADDPWMWAFDEARHVLGYDNYQPTRSLPLHLSFDFNANPTTCIVGQHWQEPNGMYTVRIVAEYRITQGALPALLTKINADWGDWPKTVTGDATGQAAHASGALPMFYTIEQNLLGHITMRTFASNPSHVTSRHNCNTALNAYDIKINPACSNLITDLKLTESTDSQGIDKKQERAFGRGHLFDCSRYYLWAHFGRHTLKINPQHDA